MLQANTVPLGNMLRSHTMILSGIILAKPGFTRTLRGLPQGAPLIHVTT